MKEYNGRMALLLRRGLTATVFLLYMLLAGSLQAQFFEGGIIVGGSLYDGDLSPHGFANKFAQVRPAYGLFMRQNLDEHWAVRFSFQHGQMVGVDGDRRADRNLSFTSYVNEVAALVEFSFPGYDPTGFRRLSPYGFIGLAFAQYNPMAVYQGRTIALRPLGTEGQGLEGYNKDFYSLKILTIPFGAGIRYALTPSLTIGAEFGPRKTFTDYLDDVSGQYASYRDLADARGTLAANLADRAHELTGSDPLERRGMNRGNARFNDWYFFGNLTISYHFYDLLSGRGRGCPMVN